MGRRLGAVACVPYAGVIPASWWCETRGRREGSSAGSICLSWPEGTGSLLASRVLSAPRRSLAAAAGAVAALQGSSLLLLYFLHTRCFASKIIIIRQSGCIMVRVLSVSPGLRRGEGTTAVVAGILLWLLFWCVGVRIPEACALWYRYHNASPPLVIHAVSPPLAREVVVETAA